VKNWGKGGRVRAHAPLVFLFAFVLLLLLAGLLVFLEEGER
jgi:hypothetical protein